MGDGALPTGVVNPFSAGLIIKVLSSQPTNFTSPSASKSQHTVKDTIIPQEPLDIIILEAHCTVCVA